MNEKIFINNIARRKSGWKVPAPGGLRGGHPWSSMSTSANTRVIEQIDYRAETEIGHALTHIEKTLLFGRFSPEFVFSRIQKACPF